MTTKRMSPRQCEIAAESYAACLLAQAGYDVLVQYGANQPKYDLAAVKGTKKLLISVKGSQDGGWPLAVKYKKKTVTYHQASDQWLSAQHPDVIFMLVQFIGIPFGSAPRVYAVLPREIAAHMKTQRGGHGHGALHENFGGASTRSRYKHQIPQTWAFTITRIDTL